jgi:hypothetical protein
MASAAALASVKAIEANWPTLSGMARMTFALSTILFALRELRRLGPSGRLTMIRTAKALQDQLEAGDRSGALQ